MVISCGVIEGSRLSCLLCLPGRCVHGHCHEHREVAAAPMPTQRRRCHRPLIITSRISHARTMLLMRPCEFLKHCMETFYLEKHLSRLQFFHGRGLDPTVLVCDLVCGTPTTEEHHMMRHVFAKRTCELECDIRTRTKVRGIFWPPETVEGSTEKPLVKRLGATFRVKQGRVHQRVHVALHQMVFPVHQGGLSSFGETSVKIGPRFLLLCVVDVKTLERQILSFRG